MMKKIFYLVAFVMSIGCVLCSSSAYAKSDNIFTTNASTFSTLSKDKLNMFSQNNILFYEPNPCANTVSAWNGEEVTWDDLNQISEGDTRASITLLASTYGELAMALQEEYGVPWELVFIQMGNESGGGVNRSHSVAINIRDKDGKYNLLGMDVPSNRQKNQWASESSYPYTDYVNGSSHEAAEYDSISLMIIGYVIGYYRNGIYDEALRYWGHQNFDFWTGFSAATCHYVGTPGSCTSSYSDPNGNGGWFYGVISDVAKEKGWPSSEEFAKQRQIEPGGNWPINGDARLAIWDAYGIAGLPSSSSVTSARVQGGMSAGDAIAEKAKELAWPVGTDQSVYFDPGPNHTGSYNGNDAYNDAARALGGGFVSAGDCANTSGSSGICYSCARFVSLTIYESGVDQKFIDDTKARGNDPHMIGMDEGELTYWLNNSNNWEVVEGYDGNGYDDLEPGDVLLWDKDHDGGMNGNISYHTFIYVGDGIVAEASNSDFAPYLHEWGPGNNGYIAYRAKGGIKDRCSSFIPGDFDNNILLYAWPQWSSDRTDATDAYQELVDSGKYYNGGGKTDCNGFVTKMIVVNEIDPNYNSEYGRCKRTLENIQRDGWGANWDLIYGPGDGIDTSSLRKGDVFLKSTHTFLFVGNIEGFECDLASASLGNHVPVACNGGSNAASYSGGEYYVFRKTR